MTGFLLHLVHILIIVIITLVVVLFVLGISGSFDNWTNRFKPKQKRRIQVRYRRDKKLTVLNTKL